MAQFLNFKRRSIFFFKQFKYDFLLFLILVVYTFLVTILGEGAAKDLPYMQFIWFLESYIISIFFYAYFSTSVLHKPTITFPFLLHLRPTLTDESPTFQLIEVQSSLCYGPGSLTLTSFFFFRVGSCHWHCPFPMPHDVDNSAH